MNLSPGKPKGSQSRWSAWDSLTHGPFGSPWDDGHSSYTKNSPRAVDAAKPA